MKPQSDILAPFTNTVAQGTHHQGHGTRFPGGRRRTRPMSSFSNTQSCDRIIYAIFHRFNE